MALGESAWSSSHQQSYATEIKSKMIDTVDCNEDISTQDQEQTQQNSGDKGLRHQILSLRPYWDKKKEEWEKTDTKHAKCGWGFTDFADMLKGPKKYLKTVPNTEQWNLYYTVA